MGLDVYWTGFAEMKLGEIAEFYRLQAGRKVAKGIVNGIIKEALTLNKAPFIGPIEPLLQDRPLEIRYLVFRYFKILYWINESKRRIDILNIFDTRQNPEKIKET